jgi:hypothetical protein
MGEIVMLVYGIGMGYTYRRVSDVMPSAPWWGRVLLAWFWPVLIVAEAANGDYR